MQLRGYLRFNRTGFGHSCGYGELSVSTIAQITTSAYTSSDWWHIRHTRRFIRAEVICRCRSGGHGTAEGLEVADQQVHGGHGEVAGDVGRAGQPTQTYSEGGWKTIFNATNSGCERMRKRTGGIKLCDVLGEAVVAVLGATKHGREKVIVFRAGRG